MHLCIVKAKRITHKNQSQIRKIQNLKNPKQPDPTEKLIKLTPKSETWKTEKQKPNPEKPNAEILKPIEKPWILT